MYMYTYVCIIRLFSIVPTHLGSGGAEPFEGSRDDESGLEALLHLRVDPPPKTPSPNPGCRNQHWVQKSTLGKQ